MNGPASEARITFLDDDHVLRLVRFLLSWNGAAEIGYAEAFFSPEIVDRAELERLGASLRRAGARAQLAIGDAAEAVAGSAAILFRRGRVTAEMMDACPELRLVQRLGESPAGIDLAAARHRGIQVSCLPRRSLVHVAEHVMLLILALSRKLIEADAVVRKGTRGRAPEPGTVSYNWAALGNINALAGRTLGIVGLGEVGALLARRAHAFDMRVLYNDRERLDTIREETLGVAYRDLDDLLAEAQIVSLHVPATPNNHHLIGETQIARMRPDCLLINTSRGELIEEDALFDALSDGRLAGAALDVHPTEPRPVGDRLCSLNNLVLTPHIAGGSRTAVLPEIEAIFENLSAAAAGKPVPHGRLIDLAVSA